jgi:hypothetical protein
MYHLRASHVFRPGLFRQMHSGFGEILLSEMRVIQYRLLPLDSHSAAESTALQLSIPFHRDTHTSEATYKNATYT